MDDKQKEKWVFWLKLAITLLTALLTSLGAKAIGCDEVVSLNVGWVGTMCAKSVLRV